MQMQEIAKELVREYVETHAEVTDELPEFEVYVVWFAKTLRNWKALVSTTLVDGKYYEVTYNGASSEAYLDVYVKIHNEARVLR